MPGQTYDQRGWYLEEQFLTRIVNFSLAYLIGGDTRYRDTAKRWMLTLARMPEWEGSLGKRVDAGVYVPFGLIALSAGCDWMYSDFTESERTLIREKLASVTANLYDAAHGDEWWTGAYWNHDCIIPLTGLGIGAIALLGEDPRAQEWLNRGIEQMDMVFDRIGDDGAWHEGVAPWAFGTIAVLIYADELERATGRSLWGRPWLQQTAYYRLYSWLPPDRVVLFDDAHPDGGYSFLGKDCAAVMYRLAHQYHNPYAQWLGDLDGNTKRSEHTVAWRFLWRDASIEPKAPNDLPLSRFFSNQDLVISRAGWGAHDPVVAFTCGTTVGRRALAFARKADGSPNLGLNFGSNHTHPDQLSFMVYADGDYLISTQGYGCYNPDEENCILIDGKGPRRYAETKEPIVDAGRVETVSFASGVDVMVGEAAACYPHDLGVERAERRITYTKPDSIVLSDVVALERPYSIEWRFQAGPQFQVGDRVRIEQRGSDYWFIGPHAAARFTAQSPANLQISIGQGGSRPWDRDHQWVSVKWPDATAEANARFLIHIEPAPPSGQ
jgi:hypothetical protein